MKISIVIPSFNGKELFRKNLAKVISACPPGCEFIIVDDGSTDGTGTFLKANFLQVKIVEHKKNQRFAAACNSGVRSASGEIVILLNNDVVPEKGFLKPLIRNFKDKKVFSVGCREIDPALVGRGRFSGRNKGEFKRGLLVHWRAKNQNKKDTLWTFGGSMAVDRKKYLELGGMDTIYKPAYWEDIDLCWRARKKGWKILFEPRAVVCHQHETTNIRELGRIKMEIAAYKNQILFVWKNIRGWQLMQHFIWLPYHLIFTTLKSNGLFLVGFIKALWQVKDTCKK